MQAKRDEIADKSDGAADYAKIWLDCPACPYNDRERANADCGWLPKSQRRPGLRPFSEAPVCPGYLITQPEVYEAARALAWQRKGQMELLYDQPPTPALRDAVDILDAACGEVEREHLRKQRRELASGTR